MTTRPVRGSISRSTLIWLVVALFLIGSGIGVFFAVRHGAKTAPPPGAPLTLNKPPPPSPESIDAVQRSEFGRAQFADKSDPNRLAGEMLYELFDPLPNGRINLVKPEFWYFMKDGRTLHLQAARGNVKLFPGSDTKPESGRFEGGVVGRIYAAGVATAAHRPDPATEPPEQLFYTSSITFDLSVGEYTTFDMVNFSSAGTQLQAEGMDIVYNEIRGRPETAHFGSGYLYAATGRAAGEKSAPSTPHDTAAAPPATPAPGSAEGAPVVVAASQPASPAPQAPPREDLYTADINETIVLSVGSGMPQTITSDRLLAWARMVDGKLPPDAIAELGNSTGPAKPSPAPAGAASPATPPVSAGDGTGRSPGASGPGTETGSLTDRISHMIVHGPNGLAPLTRVNDDGALLTWTGGLHVAALESTPEQLADQHVAVRFVSETKAPVVLKDLRSGATAMCSSLRYGATTADAALDGADGAPMTVADARGGRGEFGALRINMKTGIGQIPTPGFLTRAPRPGAPAGAPEERLNWSDQADLTFATNRSGIDALREAVFSGRVLAMNKDARVSGDVLHTWFTREGRHDSVISRVVVDGHAVGRTLDSAEPQSLEAGKIDVAFATADGGTDSTPRSLSATGGVHGERTEMVSDANDPSRKTSRRSTLTSDALDASLASDAKGNTVVTEAVARGKAAFDRSDGVSARGETIVADVEGKTTDISGPESRVAASGATLTGDDLHLDGVHNAVLAKGHGSLVHVDPTVAAKLDPGVIAALDTDQIGRTTLEWTKGMRYDASTGEGEAVGNAVAITSPDAFTVNTVRGERLVVHTERLEQSPEQKGKEANENTLGDVRILSAEAMISDKPGEGQPRTLAESRTYVADAAAPDHRRLESLRYIEGPHLIADEEHGVFRVPAAGRALVVDQSAAKPETKSDTGDPFSGSGARGTTLLEWSGTMTMNRVTELADADGGVRITHQPLDQKEKPVVLNADSVQAKFALARNNGGVAADSRTPRDQLESATARGGVRIVTDGGDRQLTADEATYDVASRVIEAAGADGGAVTFLDKTRGVPTIAKRLRWDLRTDEITILEMMPIVAPR